MEILKEKGQPMLSTQGFLKDSSRITQIFSTGNSATRNSFKIVSVTRVHYLLKKNIQSSSACTIYDEFIASSLEEGMQREGLVALLRGLDWRAGWLGWLTALGWLGCLGRPEKSWKGTRLPNCLPSTVPWGGGGG